MKPLAQKAARARNFVAYAAFFACLTLLMASFESDRLVQFSRDVTFTAQTIHRTYTGVFTPDSAREEYPAQTVLTYRRILYYDSRLQDPGSDVYDEDMRRAVTEFQLAHDLSANGRLDRPTMDALDALSPPYSLGMSGPEIKECQELLRAKGYLAASSGTYDDATYLAVIHFQSDAGIDPDGILDISTRRALGAVK